ncbi:MAG: DUF445 family protein [Syntrophomonadaceae bacterium]|nr:DUF445 family protein [Syntrophomonadaceae bacterium]
MFRLLAVPLISAMIGYLTNVVAIKMLFHPREPIRLLGLEIEGLLPRRQEAIANKIGEVVERELLSVEDLVSQFSNPEMQDKMVKIVSEKVRTRLEEAMPRLIPQNLARILADLVEGVLVRESRNLVPQMTESAGRHLTEEIRVSEIVRNRILALDVMQLEGLVREVASRELRLIEVMGGVLGFLIGLVQVAIIVLFP